jgi:hypothetical protein
MSSVTSLASLAIAGARTIPSASRRLAGLLLLLRPARR